MVYILKGTTDHTHSGYNSENPDWTSVDNDHYHVYCEDDPYTSVGGKDNHIHPIAMNLSAHDRHEYNEDRDKMFSYPSLGAMKPMKGKPKKLGM
jgi:hypothetical protein